MQDFEIIAVSSGFLTLIGVMVGSFINALVWRLHKDIKIGGTARSKCPACNHQLAWYDLIPVVSWIALRARCRHCKEPISKQYPVVELVTGLVWLVSFIALNPGSTLEYVLFGLWLVSVSSLIALAVYDIRWLVLPDRLVAIFVSAGLIHAIAVSLSEGAWGTLIDPILGVFAIAGLFYLLYQISAGTWIGGGDVKLAVGIGLFLGLQGSLLALFVASLLGSIVGLFGILVLGKSRKEVIPFGPFLIAGTVFAYLFGSTFIDWYTSILL